MTAPALILVAPGTQEARVSPVAAALRAVLANARPGLVSDVAFLEGDAPSLDHAVARLADQGRREVVFVPLDLSNAMDIDPAIRVAASRARHVHAGLAVSVARPIGPEATLLTVLDARLRSALAAARVLELDGLVLSAAGSGDVRGAALLARRARQWSTHHRLPCLVGVADSTGPSVAQAVQGLRSQGRRHIAVGCLFWGPDAAYAAQAELAHRVGALAVSDPLGATPEITELVLARYAFAAMELLDADAHVAGAPERPLLAQTA